MKRVERVEVEEGLHLAVEVHGSDTRHPPIVLVHGFMGSAASWGGLPERLGVERRVLVPDLPGHGRSDRPPTPAGYRVVHMATLLGRMADHMRARGGDWLGYSMGGRIVLAGAAEGVITPRRMVLESTSPGLEEESDRRERRAADEALAERLERDGMPPFVDRWLRLPLFATLPEVALARARQIRLANDPAAMAACLRGGGTGSQRSYWGDLEHLAVPTLILTGGADEKFATLGRRMVSAFTHARLRTLPGAGHAVHLEAPELWSLEVAGWFNGPG